MIFFILSSIDLSMGGVNARTPGSKGSRWTVEIPYAFNACFDRLLYDSGDSLSFDESCRPYYLYMKRYDRKKIKINTDIIAISDSLKTLAP